MSFVNVQSYDGKSGIVRKEGISEERMPMLRHAGAKYLIPSTMSANLEHGVEGSAVAYRIIEESSRFDTAQAVPIKNKKVLRELAKREESQLRRALE